MTAFAAFIHALDAWGGVILIVGVVLDFLTYPHERPAIQAHLQKWWGRFNSVTWPTFGKHEASAAIDYYDRFFGARLFSFERLYATVLIASIGFMVSAAWAFCRVSYATAPAAPVHESNLIIISGYVVSISVYMTLAAFLLIPVSLSFTRYLCALVLKVPTRLTFFAFGGLLAVHIALLIWWTPLVKAVIELMGGVAATGRLPVSPPSFAEAIQLRELTELSDCNKYFRGHCLALYFSVGFRGYADVLANGLRLAFAAAFFGSFLLGPLIKEPIARLWWRIAQTKKPVFTFTLGGFAAFIHALDYALQRAIGAG